MTDQNATFRTGSLERSIASWMADEAAIAPPPQVLDQILTATGRQRPLPRWLALLKEPPMRTQSQAATQTQPQVTRRVVVGTPTRRLVLVVAALVAVILAAALVVAASNLLKPPPARADDWPMFRGDAGHAGLALHGPVGRPVVKWQVQVNAAVTQSISIVGDSVFVPTDDGEVIALALADGTQRWKVTLASTPASGLIVTDGLVLVRDGNGILHALDVATGAERWKSTTSATGTSNNGSIGAGAWYAGSTSGDLVAYDIKTGVERWRAPLGAGSGSSHATAYADGLVYMGSTSSGFVAVDAATGATRWHFDTGAESTGTPVVADGIAWIGAGFVEATGTPGRLHALDAKTGAPLWQKDEPFGSPTVADGVAYSSAPDLGVEGAFDEKTGAERWRTPFPRPGPTRASVVAGGVVFVPQDGEQRAYALDAATGGELWHFDLLSANQCCIAVAKGYVFVGTDGGEVFVIGGDGSTLNPAPIPPRASP
jgi:outer membrane protein assembly factor BamB